MIKTERVPKVVVAACSAGQMEVLVELWQTRRTDVAQYLGGRDEAGSGAWQPLLLSSLNGHCEVVEWLLDVAGMDAGTAVDPNSGMSPLIATSSNGHTPVVKVLLAGGANTDHAANDAVSGGVGGHAGSTPLTRAAIGGHLETTRELVHAGADVDFQVHQSHG